MQLLLADAESHLKSLKSLKSEKSHNSVEENPSLRLDIQATKLVCNKTQKRIENKEYKECPDPQTLAMPYEIRTFPASVEFASEDEIQNDPELAEKGYKFGEVQREIWPLPRTMQQQFWKPSNSLKSKN